VVAATAAAAEMEAAVTAGAGVEEAATAEAAGASTWRRLSRHNSTRHAYANIPVTGWAALVAVVAAPAAP
jgi:hypothetical protein